MTLTRGQISDLQSGRPVDLTVQDIECVLIRKDTIQKIRQQPEYDDSEWTSEEMSALAGQMFEQLDDPEKIDETRRCHLVQTTPC